MKTLEREKTLSPSQFSDLGFVFGFVEALSVLVELLDIVRVLGHCYCSCSWGGERKREQKRRSGRKKGTKVKGIGSLFFAFILRRGG